MSNEDIELDAIVSLIVELSKETRAIKKLLDSEDSQLHRRMFIRALFAKIEGITYALKKVALEFSRVHHSEVFSFSDLLFLEEISFDLNDKGEVTSKPAKIRTTDNLQFTFKALAKSGFTTYELKKDSQWENLKVIQKVRDRLVHPKSASQLQVTKEEINKAFRVDSWFGHQVLEVLHVYKIGLQIEYIKRKAPDIGIEIIEIIDPYKTRKE